MGQRKKSSLERQLQYIRNYIDKTEVFIFEGERVGKNIIEQTACIFMEGLSSDFKKSSSITSVFSFLTDR